MFYISNILCKITILTESSRCIILYSITIRKSFQNPQLSQPVFGEKNSQKSGENAKKIFVICNLEKLFFKRANSKLYFGTMFGQIHKLVQIHHGL
jgi:hypothetical protein